MDVLDALKSQGREVLTIMITAYDFLAKPFTPDELRYALRKATSQLILSKQARKLAEEKRQVRFNFISVLAHELKAPLNAVEGYLNILRTTEENQTLHDAPASGERPSGGGEAAPAAAPPLGSRSRRRDPGVPRARSRRCAPLASCAAVPALWYESGGRRRMRPFGVADPLERLVSRPRARAPARQPSGSPASFSGSGSAAASPSTPSTSRRRS